MDRQDLTIIRPMIYIDEYMTKKATKDFNYPVIKNPCPADGKTNRQDIKELVVLIDDDLKDLADLQNEKFKSIVNDYENYIVDEIYFENSKIVGFSNNTN